jgi:hypothetical protein
MYTPAIMAFLHHVSAFTLVGALVASRAARHASPAQRAQPVGHQQPSLQKQVVLLPLADKVSAPTVRGLRLAVSHLQNAVAELLAQNELGVAGHAHEDFVEFQLAGARVADDVAAAQVIDEVAEHGAVEELG